MDAASCSGATSAPTTSRDGEQSAAAAAPAADSEPAAAEALDWAPAAQVSHGTTAAEAAEVPFEEAAEETAADAERDATAVTAKAAYDSVAGDGSATLLQDTSGRCADSPAVSITHE